MDSVLPAHCPHDASTDSYSRCTELEIIIKSGAFFSFGDVRLGQGRENAKDFLRRNVEICAEIEEQIRHAAVGAVPLRLAVSEPAPDEEEVSLQ